MNQSTLLFQGAEAKIYTTNFWGQICVVKERFEKQYRLKELDEKLTKSRILQEAKNMNRARKFGVLTPTIYLIDEVGRKIYMEYLAYSISVKEFLYQLGNYSDPILDQLVMKIGSDIAILHSNDQIHGDLTTSNMILRPLKQKVLVQNQNCQLNVQDMVKSQNIGDLYIIDFGLSFVSGKLEDKAVDLYVLKRAFISTHPGSEELFDKIIEVYKNKASNGLKIVARFKDVEKRGRKREAFG